MDQNNIHSGMAGIVLVGGRSSRMGQSKALLNFKGQPLYQHMTALLHSCGLREVILAGEVAGAANCIQEPVPHMGPARALAYIISQLNNRFQHLLVVPVDMPLLTPALLSELMRRNSPCYFEQHPLPALLACQTPPADATSMRDLLSAQQAQALKLPEMADPSMQNFNTPKEWALLQAGLGNQ